MSKDISVAIRNLDSTLSTYVLSISRDYLDRHTFCGKEVSVKGNLTVRKQANGLKVVDSATGRFVKVSEEERMAVIRLFEEAQDVPVSKKLGVFSQCEIRLEDSYLYGLEDEFVPYTIYVDTDVPRKMEDDRVVCHTLLLNNTADAHQVRDAYTIKDYGVGVNSCRGDWSEWMDNQISMIDEKILENPWGFTQEAIDEARTLVRECIGYSQTQSSWTFDVWDIMFKSMRDSYIKENLPKALEALEAKKAQNKGYAVEFLKNYSRVTRSIAELDTFIMKVKTSAVETYKDLDRSSDGDENSEWFRAMCARLKRTQDKVLKAIQPKYAPKQVFQGFLNYIRDNFWATGKDVLASLEWEANQKFKPMGKDLGDWSATDINYLMWLVRLEWEGEMAQNDQHRDRYLAGRQFPEDQRRMEEDRALWTECKILTEGRCENPNGFFGKEDGSYGSVASYDTLLFEDVEDYIPEEVNS